MESREAVRIPFCCSATFFPPTSRPGKGFRFYLQLNSALESGREEGPRPADQDRLDLHQAFAEWKIAAAGGLEPRLGRQELAFGTQRLVSTRMGLNAPRSFDGVRLTVPKGRLAPRRLRGQAGRHQEGIFDDKTEPDRTFWGFYAVGAGIDLYYFDLRRDRQRFDQGTGGGA